MKYALCDDDVSISTQLKKMLLDVSPEAEIDIYEDGTLLLSESKSYDALFCDIDMPSINGIHLGEQLRLKDKNIAIIYLTNYSDYRSMAFGVHAFDYLEKPLQKSTLKKVVEDLQAYNEVKYHATEKVIFHTLEGILNISIDEIIYFEYENRHLYMHTINNRYCLTQSLQTVYTQMKPYDFEIPHKSFCINLKHVKLLKGFDIHMTNKDILPLSQKKASQFRSELSLFLSKCLKIGGHHL